ncbi:hypothetical protein FB001_102287 [Ensifer sp. SEMIA 135]|nr:hypothetical protein FB000_101268 [Ensifer sp. SEMIA 134]TWB40382.1 hypothetical protein FB001_102287 [Ensifer sp. SEMIA 135]
MLRSLRFIKQGAYFANRSVGITVIGAAGGLATVRALADADYWGTKNGRRMFSSFKREHRHGDDTI